MVSCRPCHAGYIDAADVLRHYGRWQPPNEDEAATKHRAEHVHHDFFNVWASNVRDLKEFGIGHMMYFMFTKWMAVMFCTLAVLVGTPNMAINLAGKYFESGQLELTTLGNFGRVSTAHSYDGPSSVATTATGWELEHVTSTTFMSDATLPPATSPFRKDSAIVAASVLDCIGVAFYFVVTLGLIVLARRRAEDADVHTVTIHDYSVYVHKLPHDASSQELVDFFSQWGEVESVEMIRAYGNMLRLVLTRGQLLQQLQSAIAALQRAAEAHPAVPVVLESACLDIKQKVANLDEEIKAEQALGDTSHVVGAFVTFRNESSKLSCLKATPRSWIRQLWSLKPGQKFRGRFALLVEEAPEPSDVQYENIEHGSWARAGRTLVTACCSYTALALGFLLISLATASRVNVARIAGINQDDCASCRLTINGMVGLSDADKSLYASCHSNGVTPDGQACSEVEKQCYRCYCYTSLTSGRLSDSSYCSSAISLLVLEYTSQVGVVLAILGINMLLALTSRQLTLFEKHHTRSSEARALAHRLFLAQFLNSAVSTIIANAHLPFLANLFDGTALAGIFFQGIYTDLTPNWYKVVGRSLIISQFVGALLRMAYLLMGWATSRWYYLRRGACLTQDELEKCLRGPPFLLDHRYGEHLSVIYVSMLLCGAMPIALWSAAFWFVSSYWCDKLELLKLSCRPVIYGNTLSNHAMNLLPYAAVWHVAFALWVFSLFGVGQSRLVTDGFASIVRTACSGSEQLWLAVTGIPADQVARRLTAADAAHLLVALIVMVGVLFLKLTLTTWIQAGRWLLNMAGVMPDDEDTHQTGAPEFPVAVRTQLLVGETSYAIQDQPAYATAFTRMEHMAEDVCVKVVLKGPHSKKHASNAEHSPKQLDSPGSQSLIGGQQLPGTPQTASTVAVGFPAPAGSAASQIPTGGTPPQTAHMLGSSGPPAPPSRMAQDDNHSNSRASTKGSSSSNSSRRQSSRSSSSHGSRRNSSGAYPAIGTDAGSLSGFEAPPSIQHQTVQQLPGSIYVHHPPITSHAELERVSRESRHTAEFVGGSAAGSDVSAGIYEQVLPLGQPVAALTEVVPAPPMQLSAAQRFRQARSNQVVPIPEEYLASKNMIL